MPPRDHARAFARRAGVTVKALRYYERLGLIAPARTTSGYRIYSAADLVRIEQVRALRSLGFPLRQVADVLKGTGPSLEEAVGERLHGLTERARDVDCALAALRSAKHALDAGEPPQVLIGRLPDVVRMHREHAAMRRYFSEAAWRQFAQSYYEDWPPPKYREIYREAAALLDEPGSDRAQSLLAQVMDLWYSDAGPDPQVAREVREGAASAWADRANWPATLRQRYAEYRIEEVARFLGRASIVAFTRSGTTYLERSRAQAS